MANHIKQSMHSNIFNTDSTNADSNTTIFQITKKKEIEYK